jgi:L-alanine-DL-glutamate epimerase-like enolase superfamily enzyme
VSEGASTPDLGSTIASIEWAELEGRRPRSLGANARIGPHGSAVRVPVARLTTRDGAFGAGFARLTRHHAESITGRAVSDLFRAGVGATDAGLPVEWPLWDLVGRRAGEPVHALAAAINERPSCTRLRVRCYDTSLYFDEGDVDSDEAAGERIASYARASHERGHRDFKIKVGRGARWMELEKGTERDIAVVRAVREAVGPAARIMLDANNGYNLNLARRVLAATADRDVFWLEEPFQEDAALLAELRDWQRREGLKVLLADGESWAPDTLMEWAREGLIDVVQYDIFRHGLTHWLATGRMLDVAGRWSAPHHFGTHYGNYASAHLAGAVERLCSIEWDEASTPGLYAPGYRITEGWVEVPNDPGFGIELDDDLFRRAVAERGFSVSEGRR